MVSPHTGQSPSSVIVCPIVIQEIVVVRLGVAATVAGLALALVLMAAHIALLIDLLGLIHALTVLAALVACDFWLVPGNAGWIVTHLSPPPSTVSSGSCF
jgi:hypothetical protein